MAFVRTVSYEEASEATKEGYDAILRHSLNVPNLHSISGIRPEIMETLAIHTRTVMKSRSGLTEAEKEMIATVVLALNKCQNGTIAHAEALRNRDPGSQLAQQLGENYREAGLTEKQVSMLEFSEFLTVTASSTSQDHVNRVRKFGWTDEDIVDIAHIVGLFNYLARVVDGLGAELRSTPGREEMFNRLPFRDEIVRKPFGTIA